MRLLLCTLLLIGSLRANDCVPLTYQTLSGLMGTPVSYKEWVQKLVPDRRTAPTLFASIEAWNKRMPATKLQCIYVVSKGLDVIDCNVDFGMPYLWIGLIPDELAAKVPGNVNRNMAHAALAIVTSEEDYIIFHTVEQGVYYTERINAKEFFSRTYAVFRVHSKSPIDWKPLP